MRSSGSRWQPSVSYCGYLLASEKLQETAKYLESQLEELNSRFNTVDQNKLFVLYALMITEKYLSTTENNKELNKEFEQITNMLNNQILEKEV